MATLLDLTSQGDAPGEDGERLIANPRDIDLKVDFVTTYHMVIEGTLALTGQHFMLDYYENNELLPGFAA